MTARTRHLIVGLVVLALALATVVAGLAGPASADGPDPAIRKAQAGTASPNGTVTVTVEATNATEIDIASVPDNWTVRSHRDDFGTFANQLDGEDRVVWLWSWPVSSNVSVTFAVPPNASAGTHDLEVVPYAGTTRGDAKTVTIAVGSPGLERYANDNGVITTGGLRSAIADWVRGSIDTELLRDAIQAWVTGRPVT